MKNEIIESILKFRKDRDWRKYHNGLTLSHKLMIESAEVGELFEWGKTPDKKDLANELADVRIILEFLAYDNDIDLDKATMNKMKFNETREDYPENKWRITDEN